jgi:predicted aconitase
LGALGGVIGKLAGTYWDVPVIEGLDRAPSSDELKHFGAAMASFGSVALFHLVGITPEAARSPTWPASACASTPWAARK